MGNLAIIQHYLKGSPYPTMICDGRREIVFANEAMPGLCGYSVSGMIGKNPGKLLQGEETDSTIVTKVREQLSDGVPFEFSITNYHENGDTYHVGIFVIPFLEGEGSEQVYVGVSRKLQSLEESALDKAPRDFGKTVSHVLTLLNAS